MDPGIRRPPPPPPPPPPPRRRRRRAAEQDPPARNYGKIVFVAAGIAALIAALALWFRSRARRIEPRALFYLPMPMG